MFRMNRAVRKSEAMRSKIYFGSIFLTTASEVASRTNAGQGDHYVERKRPVVMFALTIRGRWHEAVR